MRSPRALRHAFPLAMSLITVVACTDNPTAPRNAPPSRPGFAISDGTHSGGTSHFFFLFPTVVPQTFPPPPFTGTFDATLTTAARVCVGTGACPLGSAIASFTPAGGTGGSPFAKIQVTPAFQAYSAIWDTRQCASGPCTLDPTQAYRLHVYATNAVGAEVELGFADIAVLVLRRHEAPPSVDLGNYSPLVQNLPYIIAFRIEQGVVGSVTVAPVANALNVGATQPLVATVLDLHGATLTSPVVTWASSSPAVATVNANGVIAAVAPGTATITATSQPQTGSATVTVAAAGKTLYVANFTNSILIYAAGASGNVAPTATIAGSNTGLSFPNSVAVDASGQVYVVNQGATGVDWSITVYPAGANGNVAPTATIGGSNTGLQSPRGLAVGASGQVYVANAGNGSILIFAPGANGNVAPTATISGDQTTLAGATGLAFDGSGQLHVASGNILTFPAGASGNLAPTATIIGAGATGLALDASGRSYTLGQGVQPISFATAALITRLPGTSGVHARFHNGQLTGIRIFAAGANGSVNPVAAIAGTNTGVSNPDGLAVDASGQLFVANANNTITIYAAGASGNVAPTATIAGNNTGLASPSAVALAP